MQQSSTRAATAAQFKAWRQEMGVTMREAATMLGKRPRTIEKYRDGERNIPPSVRYLMEALRTGWRPTLIQRERAVTSENTLLAGEMPTSP